MFCFIVMFEYYFVGWVKYELLNIWYNYNDILSLKGFYSLFYSFKLFIINFLLFLYGIVFFLEKRVNLRFEFSCFSCFFFNYIFIEFNI